MQKFFFHIYTNNFIGRLIVNSDSQNEADFKIKKLKELDLNESVTLESASYSIEISKSQEGYSIFNLLHSGVFGIDFQDTKIYKTFKAAKSAAIDVLRHKVESNNSRHLLTN